MTTPSITPEQLEEYKKTPEGTVCWLEIPSRDLQKSYDFYHKVFPAWKLTKTPEEVATSEHAVIPIQFTEGVELTGGIVKMPASATGQTQPMGSGATPYYYVRSIEETMKIVVEAGGKEVLSKRPEGDHGFFNNVVDPEGNRFGLYEMK